MTEPAAAPVVGDVEALVVHERVAAERVCAALLADKLPIIGCQIILNNHTLFRRQQEIGIFAVERVNNRASRAAVVQLLRPTFEIELCVIVQGSSPLERCLAVYK